VYLGFLIALIGSFFAGYFQIWNDQRQADTEREQDAFSRATERVKMDKKRVVLSAQRESMDETGRLREVLALAREERVALEVVPGCYLMLQSQYQSGRPFPRLLPIPSVATTWLFRLENLK